jgi:hypothetical protein
MTDKGSPGNGPVHAPRGWVAATKINRMLSKGFAVALGAAGVVAMLAGTFVPFVSTPCGCEGLPYIPNLLVTGTLAGGGDGRIALLLVLVLATMAVLDVAGGRPYITSLVSLGASIIAVGLGIFELLNAGLRQLPMYEPPFAFGPAVRMTLYPSAFVFLAGAALAVLASLLMVVSTVRSHQRAPKCDLVSALG